MSIHATPPKMSRTTKPTAILIPTIGPVGKLLGVLVGSESEDIVVRKSTMSSNSAREAANLF